MKPTEKSDTGSILYQNSDLLEILWTNSINIEVAYEKDLVVTQQFSLKTNRPTTSIYREGRIQA
ncbi:unnamed protein product, partial [marine sediment metagenome]